MGIGCKHDDHFLDRGNDGTVYCMACRAGAAEADFAEARAKIAEAHAALDRAKVVHPDGTYPQLIERITMLVRREAGLRAIVDKLRKTEDGASCGYLAEIERLRVMVAALPLDHQGDPIVPYTTRYYIHLQGDVREVEVGTQLGKTWTNYDTHDRCYVRHINETYATKQHAVEAAQQGKGEEGNHGD